MDSKDLYIKSLEETVDRLQKELEDVLAQQIESAIDDSCYSSYVDQNTCIGYNAAVFAGSGINTGGINSSCVTSAKVPISHTVSGSVSFMDFMKDCNDA